MKTKKLAFGLGYIAISLLIAEYLLIVGTIIFTTPSSNSLEGIKVSFG